MSKLILDLCGGTGSWSKPYADAGYDVFLVTLPNSDVRDLAKATIHLKPVHGILAAPPCDHFSVSGAQYWKAKDADGRTAQAIEIVRACFQIIDETRPRWWALENPIGRIAKLFPRLGEPKLKFDPCDYGDLYTKRTYLWGNFQLPVKRPVEPVRSCSQGSWLQKLGGKTVKTKTLRSMTPQGFARAFFEANP